MGTWAQGGAKPFVQPGLEFLGPRAMSDSYMDDSGQNTASVINGKLFVFDPSFNPAVAGVQGLPMASQQEMAAAMVEDPSGGSDLQNIGLGASFIFGGSALAGALGAAGATAGSSLGSAFSGSTSTGGGMFDSIFDFFKSVNGTPIETLANGGMPDFSGWNGVADFGGEYSIPEFSDAGWNVNAQSGGPWDGVDEAYGYAGPEGFNGPEGASWNEFSPDYSYPDMNYEAPGQPAGAGPMTSAEQARMSSGFMDALMKYGPKAAFEVAKNGLFGDGIKNMLSGQQGGGLLDGLLSGKLAPAALGALLGAMGSKDPQTATTTDNSTVTQTGLGAAQPYIAQSMADAAAWGASPLPYASSDEMVAPLNEYQRNAMATTRDLSEGSVVPGLKGAWGQLGRMTDGRLMDVNANPYLRAAIDAAIRPVTQTYQEKVLPGVRTQYNMGVDENNSRQGLAEGIAGRSYMDTVADTAATMSNRGYETGLNATMQGLNMFPALTNASMVPGAGMMTMGTVQQATEQAQADARAKYDLMKWQRIAGPAGLFNNASNTGKVTTSTGSKSVTGPAGNPLLGAVGGALTGAQIYQMLYGKG